jgi:hypothetical protein
MLDEKAFFITINQGVTLSLQTYGMTVKYFLERVCRFWDFNQFLNREDFLGCDKQ